MSWCLTTVRSQISPLPLAVRETYVGQTAREVERLLICRRGAGAPAASWIQEDYSWQDLKSLNSTPREQARQLKSSAIRQ